MPIVFDIDVGAFSGKAEGGFLGYSPGLIFFSPALLASIPNSILQIDEVGVCTTAYDEYHFPVPLDPAPFVTWSPTGAHTTLGQSAVALWAPFPRLAEFRFDLSFVGPEMVEPVEAPDDPACTLVLQEAWAKEYVALLNNSSWSLFEGNTVRPPHIRTRHSVSAALVTSSRMWSGVGGSDMVGDSQVTAAMTVVGLETTPPMFICASNLGPVPAGPAVFRVVHLRVLVGSQLEATAHMRLGLACALVGEAVVTADLSFV